MRTASKKWIASGAGVLLLLVAAFVWPTQYRYTEMKSSTLTLPVRVHRFTGTAEILYNEWLPLDGNAVPPSQDKPVELSPEELKTLRLTWKQQPRASDRFDVTIYNGSTQTLADVLVEVPIYAAPEPVPSLPSTPVPSSPSALPNSSEPGLAGLASWAVEAARQTEQAAPKLVDVPKLVERRIYRLSAKQVGGAPALQVSEWELNLGSDVGGPLTIEIVGATRERP